MKIAFRFPVFAVGAACLLGASNLTQAQILYVQPEAGGVGRLRVINADGTGDTALGLPFPSALLPAWSRDAGAFAVTAKDPQRPAQITLNAFAVNAGTGAITNVTRFEDFIGRSPSGDFTGAYSYTLALHKGFSPSGTRMAVNSRVHSRGVDLPGPGGTPPPQIESITPVLQIFNVGGEPGSQALVHVGPPLNNVHHDGEGVDWSPRGDVLVFPVFFSAPLVSGKPGVAEATALALAEPVTNGGTGRLITFPRADHIDNGPFGEHIIWNEHDYAPKFSPDGNSIAYVRSFQQVSTARLKADPNRQSIRILDLNTGADVEIARFDPALYITQLAWSPDGSAIAFDIGQQLIAEGFYGQAVQPETDRVFIINRDGSGLRQLTGSASGAPAWRPMATAPPPGSTPTPPPTTTPTPPPTSTPTPPPASSPARLGNISTRLFVGDGADALIGGLIITGNEPKNVIIRAIGPSLGAAGVQGALSNPVMELFQGDTSIAANDDWAQAGNSNAIPNGFAPADTRESAIVTTLAPGSYTAVVRGVGGETGVGLIEAYDLSSGGDSLLANISTRGRVGGADVIIGGFIAVGSGNGARVVVRAIGPSLGAAGVPGALQDPTLELFDVNGSPISANNNWRDGQAAELQALQLAPGNDLEAALLETLSAGNYTAVVRGSNGAAGVGLVEVYNVP